MNEMMKIGHLLHIPFALVSRPLRPCAAGESVWRLEVIRHPPPFASDAAESAAKGDLLPSVAALTAKLIHPPGKLAGVRDGSIIMLKSPISEAMEGGGVGKD